MHIVLIQFYCNKNFGNWFSDIVSPNTARSLFNSYELIQCVKRKKMIHLILHQLDIAHYIIVDMHPCLCFYGTGSSRTHILQISPSYLQSILVSKYGPFHLDQHHLVHFYSLGLSTSDAAALPQLTTNVTFLKCISKHSTTVCKTLGHRRKRNWRKRSAFSVVSCPWESLLCPSLPYSSESTFSQHST